jgi:hypothetical protein
MSDESANTCVICGAAEPFGLSVCPACGGTAHAVGDTLIFVQTAEARRDKRRVAEALEPLLTGRAHVEERSLVAAGHRALIRVPRASADTVVRHLALRDVPAVARTARTAWASAPVSFYAVLIAMVLVGTWAGRLAEPFLLWTSPLMALVLLLAAQLRLQNPAITTPERRAVFPTQIDKLVVSTLAQLPLGDARDLLARLVRSAEPVYGALHRVPAGGTRPRDVERLLTHACRAAIDLSDLERSLTVLGSDPGVERVTVLRDGLADRFRQGISVLYRLRAEAVDADPAAVELAELLEALDTEADAYAEARQEVTALLRESPAAD